MSRAVLASIRPEYCAYIGMEIKTNEVRKTAPNLKPPFKCYIYCTQKPAVWWWLKKPYSADFKMQSENVMGRLPYEQPYPPHPMAGPAHNLDMYGKVVAEFVCDFVTHYPQRELNGEMRYIITPQELKTTCLTYDQIAEYGAGKDLYFWHISDLKVYDKPKELYEFRKCGAETMEELDERLCDYCARTDYGEHRASSTPNGYWSCEGAWCDEAYDEYLDTEYVLTRPPQSWCYVEEIA